MKISVFWRVAVWAIYYLMATSSTGAEPIPHSVLILDQYAASLPWVSVRNAAFRTALNASQTGPISFYEEFLDTNRFSGPRYKESLKIHFGEKYRDRPIGVIVAFGPLALEYAVELRDQLWAGASVVFGEVAETAISRSNLPPAVTGTTINITLAEMIAAARVLVPELKRVVLVGDLLDNLPAYRHFREELPAATRDLDLIDLTGLTMSELRKRVADLPDHSTILYTTINLDGAGVSYVPAEALSLVAEVASRPIVIGTETFLGRGAVGGFVVTPLAVGQDAARLTSRILNGEDASTISAATNSINKPIFDWRQLKRWGVDEAALPAGTEIRFRELTAWEQYQWQIVLVSIGVLGQAALIAWLIYEHRRRSLAEAQSRHSMAELTHMNRRAAAGQLSATIAHEVNQPLTGIASRAGAALRWLRADKPDLEKVGASLEHIVAASHRAADIVTSIRAMFRKDTGTRALLDINGLIRTVLSILRIDLQKNGVHVQTQFEEQLPTVHGNKIQIQQVILNLVMNAIEAMHVVQPRILKVQTEAPNADIVSISIEDTGTGIASSDLKLIFKPLFTTKTSGTGMGLAICQSIVEGHNGRIWATPGATGGSIFNVELPTAPGRDAVGEMAA